MSLESHEVLKNVIEKIGAKRIAGDLRVSTPLVYKWCSKPPEDQHDESSGAINPLDRVAAICEHTNNLDPVRWLCEQSGGYLVKNPQINNQNVNEEYIAYTQKILQEFTTLLHSISESISNDGIIDEKEGKLIRAKWQLLKEHGEEFVTSCEKGLFNTKEKEDEKKP
jgi:hypothetical protein